MLTNDQVLVVRIEYFKCKTKFFLMRKLVLYSPTFKSAFLIAGLVLLLNNIGFNQTTTCTTTCCATTQYDSGGAAGQYGYNENRQYVYDAGVGKINKLVFSSFSSELTFDVLRVYNGTGTGGTLLATFTGNVTGTALTTPIYSTSQTITLHFTSDAANLGSGWAVGITCEAPCPNTTTGGSISSTSNSGCGTHVPTPISHVSAASPSTNRIYQWEYSINGTAWTDIAGATGNSYNPTSISQTTYYRRKSKNSACPTWGASSNTITKTVNTPPTTANAGPDITQCYNSAFSLSANTPSVGTGAWSVVSGNAILTGSLSSPTIIATLPAGQTATLRWTTTNATCTSTDNVVITNNTSCVTTCTNPVNFNGDLENEGTATNFNLSINSTPALSAIYPTLPTGWADRLGSFTVNNSTFKGAYYVKKTGTESDPNSGTHMMYINGNGACYGAYNSSHVPSENLICGRTYRVSAFIGAYTYGGGAQGNANFAIEFSTYDPVSGSSILIAKNLTAPASVSWNDINWQRYQFDITIPYVAGLYEHGDFYFTSSSDSHGILIDDVCITEISAGAYTNAGIDQSGCSNLFNLSANSVPSGYTGTWSIVNGTGTFSSINSPTSNFTMTSGTAATLRWSSTNGTCTSSDLVNLSYSTQPNITVNSPNICSGSSVILSCNDCTGNISWSTGASTNNIAVAPTSTTVYTVSCTQPSSSNLITNPGFESATNLSGWNISSGSVAITTTPANVRSGNKAVQIDASSTYGEIYQQFNVTSGKYLTIKFWGKTNNSNASVDGYLEFYNSSGTNLNNTENVRITSANYQEYILNVVVPPTAVIGQLYFQGHNSSIVYIDDVSVTSRTGCIKTATSTVTVNDNNITLASPVVSSCINHPFQDVVTVSVNVSWVNAQSGDAIKVIQNNKIETIDVNSTTSPATVVFVVPANGSSGNLISAEWTNKTGCTASTTFNSPVPCSTDNISCNILYICGLDKPYDADPFDHGMINYLEEISSGTVNAIFSKVDATGFGLYTSATYLTPISINLNDYGLIFLSPSTEGYLSSDLLAALRSHKRGILNMNYDVLDDLGLIIGSGSYSFQNLAYTNNTNNHIIYNYDNPNSLYGLVVTGGNYKPQALPSLWYTANSVSTAANGLLFKYNAHSIPSESSTHGQRVYLGFHLNGLYANTTNGGAIPAPTNTYFHPTKHFTLEAKVALDQAIKDATSCGIEICDNGIDDDGDGLLDCLDSDCGITLNREFDEGQSEWLLSVTPSSAATWTVDKTNQISGQNSARINTTASSGVGTSVQLSQIGLSFTAGKTYSISFKAKANAARSATMTVQQTASPFTVYSSNTFNLTTTSSGFSFSFTPSVTITGGGKICFNVGNVTGIVHIDDVQFAEVCCTPITPGISGPNIACSGTAITLTASATGGTSPFTYIWNNSLGSGSTKSVTPTANTTYAVTVTDFRGCTATVSKDVTFATKPPVSITGASSICPGTTTTLSPTTGGTWVSSNTGVATVSSAGVVTGVASGNATFTFTNSTNGCSSLPTSTITVNPKPAISITGPVEMCVGSTTNLTPASGGTWQSDNITVATITNGGVVSALASGSARFAFTSSATGCVSNQSNLVTVYNPPNLTSCIEGDVFIGASSAITEDEENTRNANRSTHPEVEGCVYNLEVRVGETFNLRDYFHIKDENIVGQIDWSQVFFTYTALGANSPTSPADWNLANFNAGLPVTITAADASAGGNSGTGQFRIYIYRSGQSIYDDHMEIRIDNSSNINTVKCPTWITSRLYKDNDKNSVYNPSFDTPYSGINVTYNFSSGTANKTTDSQGYTSALGPSGNVTVSVNTTQLPGGIVLKPGSTSSTVVTSSSTPLIPISLVSTSDIDIEVVTSVSNPNPVPGSSVTVNVAVTNKGPAAASSVNVRSWYPVGYFTGINSVSNSGTSNAKQVAWSGLNLALNQTINLTYIATVPVGTTNFRVRAEATAAGQNDSDSNFGNFDGDLTLEDDESFTNISASCSIDTICIGGIINLSAISSASGTVNYQWYVSDDLSSWNAIASATSNKYSPPATTLGTKYYRVIASYTTSGCGSNTSTSFRVTVIGDPSVSITNNNANVCSGGNAVLTSSPSGGSGMYSYQWQLNTGTTLSPIWTDLSNGIPLNSTYTGITDATLNIAGSISDGSYQYRILVTDSGTGCGVANATSSITYGKPTVSITGATSICPGATTTLSPTTGGTWASNNTAIATVANNGIVTGVAAGNTTFVFTSSTGCISNPTSSITVTAKPNVTITGANSICPGETTTLTPNAGGTWSSSNALVATITNAGIVTGVAAGSATFTFTNSTTGCISNPSASITIKSKPTVSISGSTALCVGSTTSLLPNSGGTWASSNPSVATVTNAGIVTALTTGSATFSFTSSATLCTSDPTTSISFNSKPTVSISGASEICIGGTTNLTPNTGGTWLPSNPTVASISSTGVVTGLSAGTSTFTFTNSASGCSSEASAVITINPSPSISFNYNGSQCLTLNSSITANVTGGSPNYNFSWTGPGGYTASSQIINVNQTGSFILSVSDSKGCSSSSTATIYNQFIPQIVTIGSAVCEGATVNLSAQGTNMVSYLWSSNANNEITNTVTVSPSFPSSTYSVTVTNNQACTAVANTTINVIQKPSVSVSGPAEICINTATSLSPSTGGSWTSNNPAIASVSNTGIVTGLTQGTATFTFTNLTTGCVSNATLPITISSKPTVTISGSTTLCIASTSALLPNTGGSWYSSNPGVATISNSGIVTAISEGTATFTFTESGSGCTSDPSGVITVLDEEDVTITGDNAMCVGEIGELEASRDYGAWSSSNTNILTIDEDGEVVALAPGTVIVTYSRRWGSSECLGDATFAINIAAIPSTSITGPVTICAGTTTSLAPVTGGTWVSSNPAIASVNNGGLVTGISNGSVTFMFTSSSTGCSSALSSPVNVVSKPTISYAGPTSICTGSFTQLNPGSGGTWSSSNGLVASIDNNGIVIGISAGQATFIYTSGTTGCSSSVSQPLTVNSKPSITANFNGSQCLTDNSILGVNLSGGTAPFTYSWTGPADFISTNASNNILINGTYYVTVTDANLCSANLSASVYETYEPLIVSLQTNICEGQAIELAVSASNVQSYQWDANANNANTQNVTVYPTVSVNTYKVTVTNTVGCAAVAQAIINVTPKPQITLSGPSSLCIGGTANFTSNSTGIWSSSNASVAIITNTGQVQAISIGSATFTFEDSSSGCISDPSVPILVGNKPPVNITGANNICIGSTTTLSPVAGGTWASSDTSVATITNNGLVTGISGGTATFTFSINDGQCVSDPSAPVTINNKPTVTITGNNSLCLGGITNLSPNSGGTWTSNNPGVASVTNNGIVSAISAGTATFTFYQNASNCFSLPTSPVVVNPKPIASIAGDSVLCVGESTQLNSNGTGIWVSSNNAVATVNNDGQVFAQGPGQTVFTFTNSATGCKSNATKPVIVNALPYAVITGPASTCIGGTTSLSPQIGGTWLSTNPSIANVDNQGIVNTLAVGNVNFIFTENSSGCVSNVTSNLVVYDRPTIALSGPNNLCIGSNTSFTPTTGGIWSSLNPTIATITNGGIVTAYNVGIAKFIFTESGTGCISDTSAAITITGKPSVTINGPTSICVGQTTSLTPDTGGTWTSSNNSIATISNNGIVTGVSQGIVTFTFAQTGGCTSLPSAPITVNGKTPTSISGPTTICIGSQSLIFPSNGGTWQSADPNIATITNTGIITATGSGKVKFIYTNNSTGCTSDSSTALTVLDPPFVSILGSSNVCVGTTTQVSPTAGGVWVSSDNSIATVNNSGIVNGVANGSVNLTFTSLTTGCQSTTPLSINVNLKPIVSLSSNTLCEGSTLSLTSPEAGVWTSKNPAIASVTPSGVITGLSQGVARFAFTSNLTGCVSENTSALTVNGAPQISISGSSNICIGSTTQMFSGQPGNWFTITPSIVNVNSSGLVTGLANGTGLVGFTASSNGCKSKTNLPITVGSSLAVGLIGESSVCMGYTTSLTPNSGGVWSSSDQGIATVSNSGIVTGNAPGKVTFTFTEDITGCVASLVPGAVTIHHCTDPDFNATFLNQVVHGNVATNDEIPGGQTNLNENRIDSKNRSIVNVAYGLGQVVNITKPSGSISELIMNNDGSYQFTGNKEGLYVFNIPVCIGDQTFGCPTQELFLNIVDPNSTDPKPIANVDIATTKYNLASELVPAYKWVNTLENDKCSLPSGCDFDITTLSPTKYASHGQIEWDANGQMKYTAGGSHMGMDTIIYNICIQGTNNCTEAKHIITTNSLSAVNTVVAADDFNVLSKGETSIINVKNNDSDPEGNLIDVVSQGSALSPIVIPQGSYFVQPSGLLTFTPNPDFSGPVDIIYELEDQNSFNVASAFATAHFLVTDNLKLKLRVYLEGALIENNNQVSNSGRPLMRDNIRKNPFNGKNYIPLIDPYTNPTDYVDVTAKYVHIGQINPAFEVIEDSAAVFSVDGENAIVDWIFVELRDKNNYTQKIATRAGLLQRDGDIVELDGITDLSFNVSADSFYVVVRHRSHLGAMSLKVANNQFVDFTSPSTPLFDFGTTKTANYNYTGLATNNNVKQGYRALWAGDANGDGKIKFVNPNDDLNFLFYEVFSNENNLQNNANYNFAYDYFQGDYNMNGKSKFDNPDDDKNLLYAQILFYPLNTQFLSNFNFLIEQVP